MLVLSKSSYATNIIVTTSLQCSSEIVCCHSWSFCDWRSDETVSLNSIFNLWKSKWQYKSSLYLVYVILFYL